MIRFISTNAKRTPKPSGKKPKSQLEENEDVLEDEQVNETLPEDFGYYDKQGRAVSQANKFSKKQKRKKDIPFVDSFKSSNIDAVAYDPEKKQLWVRFKGNDVYTYFNVPLQIYRGFWSAPSKGHYFWEKIRKNSRIKYQKITASRRLVLPWVTVHLNSAKKEQANIPSIAKSLKDRSKKEHPEWNWVGFTNLHNGKRISFEEFSVELAGYSNKVRVNIIGRDTDKVDFSTTDKTNTKEVVDYIMKRIDKKIQSLLSCRHLFASRVADSKTVDELYEYLKKSFPERTWKKEESDDSVLMSSGDFDLLLTEGDSDGDWVCDLSDSWSNESIRFTTTDSELVSLALSESMRLILQGVSDLDNY